MVEEIFDIVIPESVDKKERLAPRVLLFVFILFFINYYVLSNLYLVFGLEMGQFFSFLFVFLSFVYVLGAAAIRYSNNVFAKILNVLGSLWLGFCVIALFFFLVFDLLFLFNLISFEYKLIFSFYLTMIFFIYSIINALFIFNKKIVIKSDKIKSSKRIVQISDLHIGAAHKNNFLENIVRRINNLKPDIVFITGDLIDGKHKYIPGYFNILKNISAPTYMVTGNHERVTGMRNVSNLLKDSGVVLLRGGKVKFDELSIIGIDDVEKPSVMLSRLSKIGVSESDFNILLFHRPKKFKKIAKRGVDLMLSGHTHGGQIFPLNFLMRLYYKRVKGFYKRGGSYFYVSSGTGWWGPPMRLGSKNEIVLFELVQGD